MNNPGLVSSGYFASVKWNFDFLMWSISRHFVFLSFRTTKFPANTADYSQSSSTISTSCCLNYSWPYWQSFTRMWFWYIHSSKILFMCAHFFTKRLLKTPWEQLPYTYTHSRTRLIKFFFLKYWEDMIWPLPWMSTESLFCKTNPIMN